MNTNSCKAPRSGARRVWPLSARSLLVASAAAFGALTASAAVLDYALDMNSRPSAQGWSHVGSNIGEEVFTASGGTLAWNTMPYGVDLAFNNYSYYGRTPAHGSYDSSPWTLFWDVRVLESEPGTPAYYWAGAFTSVSLDGYNLGIGLGTDNISIFKEYYAWSVSFNFALPEPIDDWTQIRVETTDDRRFSIFLDDVLLDLNQGDLLTTPSARATHKFLGAPSYVPTWDNLLGGGGSFDTTSQFIIGDGSIGSNARTETRTWYVTQLENPVAPSIPEPATAALLLGCGCLFLAATARRCRYGRTSGAGSDV